MHTSNRSKKSISKGKVNSRASSQKDEVPSVKDIKGQNSCSTIEKIQPNDLMEDSLNTCSMNKNSAAKQSVQKPLESVEKEESFVETLATAINYFTTPHLKVRKSKAPNKNVTVYNHIGKKSSKFMNMKLKGNRSLVDSFSDFRSPSRMLRAKINKFNADKVLKTEHDALPDDHTFYLLGTDWG